MILDILIKMIKWNSLDFKAKFMLDIDWWCTNENLELEVSMSGNIRVWITSNFSSSAASFSAMIIEAAYLIPIFFIKNKWAVLGLLTPLGIACFIFNGVPYAFVGVVSKESEIGTMMGILNIFSVVGQQATNWVLGSEIGAAIMCIFIIVPEQNETLDNDDIPQDEQL